MQRKHVSHLLNVVSRLQRGGVASDEHAARKQIQVVILRRISGTLEHVQHLLSHQEATWSETERIKTRAAQSLPYKPPKKGSELVEKRKRGVEAGMERSAAEAPEELEKYLFFRRRAFKS